MSACSVSGELTRELGGGGGSPVMVCTGLRSSVLMNVLSAPDKAESEETLTH